MSRRDLIKDLYAGVSTENLAAANSTDKPAEASVERVLAAPVRSMGLVLDRMEDESRVLQEALAPGASVIELDATLIDASFVRDRFPEGDAEFEDFKASIAECCVYCDKCWRSSAVRESANHHCEFAAWSDRYDCRWRRHQSAGSCPGRSSAGSTR